MPAVRDYTEDPNGVNFTALGGFGNVFGPTVNNASKRESFAGSFTAYVGNHEIKVGGDYTNDATFGSTFFTGAQRVRIRPCLQDGGANECDLASAPFYTNASGETHQVFYQHDLLADGTTDDFEIIDASPFNTPTKRYSGFIQDQWRIIPTLTMNLGVRYDAEQFFGFSPDPDHRRVQGVRSDQPVGAARRPRVGLGGRRHFEAVRFGRPLLFRASDGLERPRVHGQLGAPDLQLRLQLDHPGRQRAPRPELPGRQRVGRARGWLDERRKEWDPPHQGVLPGRADARRREGSRSDALDRPEGHLPHPGPHDRRPLRPRR